MQFRLRTLMIVMLWLALAAFALRQPTALWSGLIAFLTLLSLLIAALLVIFKTPARISAIGYFVFCFGYLAYVSQVPEFSVLKSGLSHEESIDKLFVVVHPDKWEPMPVGGEILMSPPYDGRFFSSVCHHAFACVLGLIGAGAAQWVHRKTG